MAISRFTVYTFRGFYPAGSYDDAYNEAKRMIYDIKADGFDKIYWWAKILDNNKSLFKIIWLQGNFYFSLTSWLKN